MMQSPLSELETRVESLEERARDADRAEGLLLSVDASVTALANGHSELRRTVDTIERSVRALTSLVLAALTLLLWGKSDTLTDSATPLGVALALLVGSYLSPQLRASALALFSSRLTPAPVSSESERRLPERPSTGQRVTPPH